MSRFILSTTESSDKHIPVKPGKLLFEISRSTELSTSVRKSKLGDPDVTFRVGCNTFHGHKSVFGSMSSELKRCFDISGQGFTERTPFQFGGVLKIAQNGTSGLTVTVDSKEDVFKLFIDYCYCLKISVPIKTLPSLYLLSKRLDVPSLYAPCADYLSRHVNLDIIGELSHLVEFSILGKQHFPDDSESTTNNGNGCAAAELQLASAVHEFLLQKADLVASSSTGQLSTRLLVNLTTVSDDLTIDDPSGSPPASCPAGRQNSAFSVLRWCHERVVLGERLARSGSEENVLSDDEDEETSGRAGAISCAGPNTGRDSLTDGAALSDPVGKRGGSGGARAARMMIVNNNHLQQRPTNGHHTRLDLESCSSTDDDDEDDLVSVWEKLKLEKRRSTKDVRIALDRCDLTSFVVDEDNVGIPEDLNQSNGHGSSDGQAGFQILSYGPKDGGAETETCLLAPTSLGAGATSIWLGKLTGRLVSLSVKNCRPSPAGVGRQLRSTSLASLLSGGDCDGLSCSGASSGNGVRGSAENDEAGLTVTPTSALQLAKAAATVCECQVRWDEMSAMPRLLETRSGAGAGLLSADCTPLFGDEDEKQQQRLLLLLVAGGYTRRGCMDSVEMFACGREAGSLSAPLAGPLLTRLRGRLAVATTSEAGGEPSAVYACGGSNGSVDLASVERLTSQSLSDWLSARTAPPDSASGIASSHLGESSQAVTGRSVWQTVRRLNQPRSCPCAVGLSPLSGSGHLVTPGSVLVAGGLIGATALASVECFDSGRDEWIRLPDMLEGRVGASCAVLPSRQLVVVAGGTSTAATGVCHPCFSPLPACVEALDLRTPAWTILPCPPPSVGTGGLRGCCLLPSPSGQDDLLMVGGFNGREALDAVWRFDSTAWRWDEYTRLKTPRSGACGVTWPDRSCSVVVGGFNMTVPPSGFLDSIELLEPPA